MKAAISCLPFSHVPWAQAMPVYHRVEAGGAEANPVNLTQAGLSTPSSWLLPLALILLLPSESLTCSLTSLSLSFSQNQPSLPPHQPVSVFFIFTVPPRRAQRVGSQTQRGSVLACMTYSCVTLSKLLILSAPYLPHLQQGLYVGLL